MARAVFLLVLAWASGACLGREPADPVIATIAGAPLTHSELDAYVSASTEEAEGTASAELKAALFDQLIEERLLLKAAEEAGIGVDPAELAKLEQTQSATQPPARKNERVDAKSYVRIRKLMFDQILKDVTVTDEEVARSYDERRAEFRRPQAVDVSQILLEEREEAEKIRRELAQHPDRFEILARNRSVGPEASRGGYLGTFSRGELPPTFEDEIFGASKGDVTPVVQTDFGFHIFRINLVSKPRDLTLKETSDTIRVELLRKKSDAAMELYLAELRKTYRVEIFSDRLSFAYRDRRVGGD